MVEEPVGPSAAATVAVRAVFVIAMPMIMDRTMTAFAFDLLSPGKARAVMMACVIAVTVVMSVSHMLSRCSFDITKL